MAANQTVETGFKDIVFGLEYKVTDLKLFEGRNNRSKKNKINNDLDIRTDISLRNQLSLYWIFNKLRHKPLVAIK